MTEEQIALARRAVACKGWRWMPGMADLWGGRMREGDGIDRIHALPDLTDPATLGCLLALVREAWKDHRLACVPWRLGWAVDRVWRRNSRLSEASTESEVLISALEAAP